MKALLLARTRIVLSIALFVISAISLAQTTFNPAEIAKKVTPSVVLIKGTSGEGELLGTGFIIASDGKIATALHVIQDLKSGGVRLSNREIFDSFSILAFDQRKDLAIIKVPGFDLPSIGLGNSNEVSLGDQVLLVGNPKGLEGTVTAGIVSALRDMPEGFKVIQTDAATNPGNSGGPLLNSQGQVIGVLDFKLRGAENLNFALPINYVRGMLSSLQSPMSLDEMRAKLDKKPDLFKSDGYPARWKSLQSGTVKVLRFEGDYVYIETLMPENSQKAGAFTMGEVKKQGERYIGVTRERGTCDQGKKWCTVEFPTELLRVSPSRIEGRILGATKGARFDCKKCAYSGPSEWTSFVWIPE